MILENEYTLNQNKKFPTQEIARQDLMNMIELQVNSQINQAFNKMSNEKSATDNNQYTLNNLRSP